METICTHCNCIIMKHEPIRRDDDGNPLHVDCYAKLYAERDAEDEEWQRGDWERERALDI